MAPQSQSPSVESLAEEFLLRIRRGEKPSVDEYALRYPPLAREIREFFPALRLVENFKPGSGDDAASGLESGPTAVATPLPASRLGDFQIVREIGRGGMGVVYEAVQESLGRPVALKVLPPHALADASKRKRFEREARAAARLHHTNIVPVFGIGQDNGVHYYAMQFINGLGLDKVLSELRRIRGSNSAPAAFHSPGQSAPSKSESATVAEASDKSATPWNAEIAAPYLAGGSFAECRDLAPLEGELPATSASAASFLQSAATGSHSDTVSFSLPGPGDGSGYSSLTAYWQSVARIGVQVSEALQYAHDHGVLHRDIKPSNLLLDARGTVWVTDFGLAKADDQDDLTHSGDLLGTLRYIAPEMFGGKADARSDIYSLGLTLYELLALRAAFDQTNRHELVRHVVHEAPPRLRSLDRQIPRDLETIVHKAIDRDPVQRYPSAVELAADLQRFLRDEPIRARPLSAVARCARWCRRNPRTAALTAAIALLLVVVGVGGIAWTIEAESARQRIAQAEAQRLDAEMKALIEEAQRLGAGSIADSERAIELLTSASGHQPEDSRLYLFRGMARYNLTIRRASVRDYREAVNDLELALRLRPRDPQVLETLTRCLAEYSFLDADQRRALSRCRELLTSWLAEQPEEARALAILAQCELACDRPQAAVQVCRNATGAKLPAKRSLLFHLGWAYRELGQHELAVQTLSQAIELNPRIIDDGQTLVSVYAARSSSQLALERRPLAEQDLRQALRVAPPQEWSFFDWYSVVSLLRTYGDHERALSWSDQFLQTAPQCGPAWHLKGKLLADQKRTAEAVEHYLKAIELCPQYEGPYLTLTHTYFHSGDADQAEKWTEQWLAALPESRAAHRWRGLLRFTARKHEDALSDLDRAIELGEHDSEAHYLRARVYAALKQYDRAESDFDRSLQLNPTDEMAYQGRGRLHFSRGRFEEAVSDFSEVLRQHSQNAEMLLLRGDALRRLGRHADALVDLDQSLFINSRSATARDRRGLVQAALGNHDQALTDFALALEINPREPWVHRHIVDVHVALKDYQAAARHCQEWIRADSASSEPHRALAQVLLSAGDRQSALDELANALRKDPRDADAVFLRGRVYAALGQHAKTLADCNLALELRPGFEAIYYSRGMANAALRRYPAAVTDFTRAINRRPTDGWLRYHRANAYRFLRRYDEALADADKAVECDQSNPTFRMIQGRIHAASGNLRGALGSFRKAMELDRDEPFVRQSVVTALCTLKEFNEAKAICTGWISEEQISAEALRFQGYVSYKSGDYSKALSEFDAAIDLHPDDNRSWFYRGITHLALGNHQRGETDLEQSLKHCPQPMSAEHHAVVGEYFAQSRDWSRAAKYLAGSVEADPLDVRRTYLLALVQLAALDEPGYEQTRLRMLKQHALTEDPGAAELIALIGGMRKITSDGELWIALANLAVENRPDSASCRCALGAVLLRTGRAREALTQLELAQHRVDPLPAHPATIAEWTLHLTTLARRELGDSESAATGRRPPAEELDNRPDIAWASYIEPPPWSQQLIAELLRREASGKDRVSDGKPN